jgi:hypothetical protein
MRPTMLLSIAFAFLGVAAASAPNLATGVLNEPLQARTKPKTTPKPAQGKLPSAVKPSPVRSPAQKPTPSPTPKNPAASPPPASLNKLPPSRSCKQLALDEIKFEKLDQEEIEAQGFTKRSPHRELLQRGSPKAPKGTNRPCAADGFESNDFEPSGVEKVQNVRSY